eukprot:Nitzschia sp. Nitz4//scaffold43_size134323//78333//80146//NITZ4_003307-RA/size134323-augustus-gene-0.223-mRNA-1//1//CDS//3329551972//1090//frame0
MPAWIEVSNGTYNKDTMDRASGESTALTASTSSISDNASNVNSHHGTNLQTRRQAPPSSDMTQQNAHAVTPKLNDRSAVVLALFGPSAGPCDLAGDFSTTYNRINGRLYVVTTALLFYSNLFGFERRVCLQFSDIDTIEAYRSTSIRISMVDCEEYVFRKFEDRDAVVRLLHELLEKQDTQPRVFGGGPISDEYPFPPLSQTERWDGSDNRQETENVGSTRPSLRPRAQSVPSLAILDSKERIETSLRPRRFRRTQSQHAAGGAAEDSEASNHVKSKTFLVGESDQHPPGFDLQSVWKEAQKPYPEVALEELLLSCSVEDFLHIFVSNEASFPIARYQQEVIHDREISYTKWQSEQQVAVYPPMFHREVHFIHPLNNSVGPSQAKTQRKQQLQRFGTLGAVLQNQTTVHGVPGADCFRMEDRWIIERVSDTTIHLSVTFQIVFFKRTLFKPVIQKNTRSETKKWFKNYTKFVLRALAEEEGGAKVLPHPETHETDNDTIEEKTTEVLPVNSSNGSLGWTLFGFVSLLLLLVILYQLMVMQQALLDVQQQLQVVMQQNHQLMTMAMTSADSMPRDELSTSVV